MEYSVRVMSYETYKGWVEFNVRVKAGQEGIWHFRRRFSALKEWDEELRREFGAILPLFPPKTWCRSFDSDFLRDRAQSLESYLQQLSELQEVTRTDLYVAFMQPRDSVYLVNPSFKCSRASEMLEKAFRSTEAECNRVMQMTLGRFMSVDGLPSPIDDFELVRRRQELEALLEPMSPLSWPASLPYSTGLPAPPCCSQALAWMQSRTSQLLDSLQTADIPGPELLVLV